LAALGDLSPGSITWEVFEADYWKSVAYATVNADGSRDVDRTQSIFGELSERAQHSKNSNDVILFPNRRCWEDDYSSMTEIDRFSGDITPPFCNTEDYNEKPRTTKFLGGTRNVITGVGATADCDFGMNNLFPMQTRTRVEALARSNSAYFISIIVVQWADLMICKTRIRSLFEQGMTNTFMNYSLFFETILGAFLVYVPVANTVCGTRPLRFSWWTAGVPFSLAIYMYDEFRKGWIRKNEKGWIHRNTYW